MRWKSEVGNPNAVMSLSHLHSSARPFGDDTERRSRQGDDGCAKDDPERVELGRQQQSEAHKCYQHGDRVGQRVLCEGDCCCEQQTSARDHDRLQDGPDARVLHSAAGEVDQRDDQNRRGDHRLLYGAEKSADPVGNRRSVNGLAARLGVLDFDAEAAAHAAEIRAALERQGQVIGPYDLLIAGHARSRGLVVVTGNLREFQRVAGLRSEDWLA